MKSMITKAEAAAFKLRWTLANIAEMEELRATPIDHKLRQLAALMASAEKLDWTETTPTEISEVMNRWIKLRRAYLD